MHHPWIYSHLLAAASERLRVEWGYELVFARTGLWRGSQLTMKGFGGCVVNKQMQERREVLLVRALGTSSLVVVGIFLRRTLVWVLVLLCEVVSLANRAEGRNARERGCRSIARLRPSRVGSRRRLVSAEGASPAARPASLVSSLLLGPKARNAPSPSSSPPPTPPRASPPQSCTPDPVSRPPSTTPLPQ